MIKKVWIAKIKGFTSDFLDFCRLDFKFIFSVFSSPAKSLGAEYLGSLFAGRKPFKVFVLPMAFVAFIATILGLLFSFSDNSVDIMVLKALFRFFILLLSYYLICICIKWITQRWFDISLSMHDMELFVVSLMTVTFTVQILTSLFPMLFFFNFVYIYIAYLVWLLMDTLVPIQENSKNRYIVIVTLCVIGMPLLVEKVLLLLIPNVA